MLHPKFLCTSSLAEYQTLQNLDLGKHYLATNKTISVLSTSFHTDSKTQHCYKGKINSISAKKGTLYYSHGATDMGREHPEVTTSSEHLGKEPGELRQGSLPSHGQGKYLSKEQNVTTDE